MRNRNPKQCKERWANYLSPDVCLLPWTDEEDQILLTKVAESGAKWVQLKAFFPKRSDANLKNRWFILMRRARKMARQGTTEQQKEKKPPPDEKNAPIQPMPQWPKLMFVDFEKHSEWEGPWF
jgi:hypothetical protein